MKTKIQSVLFLLAVLGMFLGSTYILTQAAEEINKKGLKHIIEEVWEGTENQ